MVLRLDKERDDPYIEIRRSVPPPNRVIKSKKDDGRLWRKRKKELILQELAEWFDDLPESIEIL